MWDGKTSEYFPIENGVRQGDIVTRPVYDIYGRPDGKVRK